MVISCGRSRLIAASNSVCSGSVGLDSPSCTTGMLDAEYLMISGGVMPGGSWRTCVCSTATTCAIAVWMLASGWKKTLMTVMPASEVDSMCSMSLTVVVRPRSFCAGDPLPHLLRRQAVVVPDDADHRNVDFRKDVGRHVQQRERRRQHDQHRHHDERVGAA